MEEKFSVQWMYAAHTGANESAKIEGFSTHEAAQNALYSLICKHNFISGSVVSAAPVEPEELRMSGLDFGEALARAREGSRVARAGWRSEVWVTFVDALIPFLRLDGVARNPVDQWVPGQGDMLSSDWRVV